MIDPIMPELRGESPDTCIAEQIRCAKAAGLWPRANVTKAMVDAGIKAYSAFADLDDPCATYVECMIGQVIQAALEA